MNSNRTLLLLMVFFLVPLYTGLSDDMRAILKNFEIPIFSKEGDEKGFLKGSTAEFKSADLIHIQQADAILKPTGQHRSFHLETQACDYTKSNNQIEGDQPVTIDSTGMIIDGYGMFWDMNTSRLTILKNVTVDIEPELFKQAGKND